MVLWPDKFTHECSLATTLTERRYVRFPNTEIVRKYSIKINAQSKKYSSVVIKVGKYAQEKNKIWN